MEEKISFEQEASQVNEQARITPKKLLIYTLLGTFLIILGTGLIFSGKKKEKKVVAINTETVDIEQMNRELQSNLDSLQRLNQQAKKDLTQLQQESPANNMNTVTSSPKNTQDENQTRAYLARLNAPTLMYSTDQATGTDLANNPLTANNSALNKIYAGKGSNAAFINQNTSTDIAAATVIPHPEATIASGEFIHAVLETAINSDLPGNVRAIVSMPVYAYTGEQPLIPAGSRLLGQYASSVVQGQQRVLIVWNRVILPNGISAQLDSPSSDALGQGGQGADSIETHFWARFGQSTLLSILGAGTATTGVNSSDQYNSASEYRMAIAQSLNDSAAASLENSINNSPTLHIEQGADINVFVARDMSFYEVLHTGEDNG